MLLGSSSRSEESMSEDDNAVDQLLGNISEDDQQLPLSDLRPCVFGQNGVPAAHVQADDQLSNDGSGRLILPYANSRPHIHQKLIFRSPTLMMKPMRYTKYS